MLYTSTVELFCVSLSSMLLETFYNMRLPYHLLKCPPPPLLTSFGVYKEEAAPFSDPFRQKRMKDARKREKEKASAAEIKKREDDSKKKARKDAAAAAARKTDRHKARTIDSDDDADGDDGGKRSRSRSGSSRGNVSAYPSPSNRSRGESSGVQSGKKRERSTAKVSSAGRQAARAKVAPASKRRRLGADHQTALSSPSSSSAPSPSAAKPSKDDLLLRAMPSIPKKAAAAAAAAAPTTPKKPFSTVWAEAFKELKIAMSSKIPRNYATNQQLVVLEQAAQPARTDLQNALSLIMKMKDWKTKDGLVKKCTTNQNSPAHPAPPRAPSASHSFTYSGCLLCTYAVTYAHFWLCCAFQKGHTLQSIQD